MRNEQAKKKKYYTHLPSIQQHTFHFLSPRSATHKQIQLTAFIILLVSWRRGAVCFPFHTWLNSRWINSAPTGEASFPSFWSAYWNFDKFPPTRVSKLEKYQTTDECHSCWIHSCKPHIYSIVPPDGMHILQRTTTDGSSVRRRDAATIWQWMRGGKNEH